VTARRLAWAAVVILASSCGGPVTASVTPRPSSGSSAAPVELTIYAASSLAKPMERITQVYEADHPGITLSVATGSSAALRAQIEQGAPADVFLSADTVNPAALLDLGLADGNAIVFAGNQLALIVPLGNPAGIRSPQDLALPGVKVVAAGDQVPISKYVEQAVALLAREPGYPPDFAAAYAANIVSREDDVEAVKAKIALGEGDAAFVYKTDAIATSEVGSFDLPHAADVAAYDAGVVIRGSRHLAAAGSFLLWLAGPDGVAVLGEFGFLAPP
jgi:molybdate transport system substrate-binding protein